MSALLVPTARPTVQEIVGPLWAALSKADPSFSISVPNTFEGAEACIGLLLDWLLNADSRWFHYGALLQEARVVLVELEEAARLAPVGQDHGPKVCTCHVSVWASLGCPVHGLDVPDHLEEGAQYA